MHQRVQTPKRVLVVDDDADLAWPICEVLTMGGGFQVENVRDS